MAFASIRSNIEPGFAQVFGNAIREYAPQPGKKNFTFGEVYDSEEKIAISSAATLWMRAI